MIIYIVLLILYKLAIMALSGFTQIEQKLAGCVVKNTLPDVIESLNAGKVVVLKSDTGSGKTLLGAPAIANFFDDIDKKGMTLVLAPRRTIASDAFNNLMKILGLAPGKNKEIGYVVGRAGENEVHRYHENKLVFTTYGFALVAGLLKEATTVILDEAHEGDMEISAARTVLHDLLKKGSTVRVLEMSATLDVNASKEFWSDVKDVAVHAAKGMSFPCDLRHVSSKKALLEEAIVDLLEKKNRTGIIVFRPGEKEVEETARKLRALNMDNVEISVIYGRMNSAESQKKALAAPQEGNRKILVGTNVLESGMNIPWLDAGVTDGMCKVPYVRPSGAEALVREDLPQWRIDQQKGRTNRFRNSIFVIHSETVYDQRPEKTDPEITRLLLTEFVLLLVRNGLKPLEVKLDAPVPQENLIQAQNHLKNYGFINDDWSLTEAGQFACSMPVSYAESAMIYKARQLGTTTDGVMLAALKESSNLRRDLVRSHNSEALLDSQSDMIDSLAAFKEIWKSERDGINAEEKLKLQEKLNVNPKAYEDVKFLVKTILEKLNQGDLENDRPAEPEDLQRILLAGHKNDIFVRNDTGVYVDALTGNTEHMLSNYSALHSVCPPIVVGSLKEIMTKSGHSLTIVERLTGIPPELFWKESLKTEGMLSEPEFYRHGDGKDICSVRYFGNERISLPIPHEALEALQSLFPEYDLFRRRMNAVDLAEKFGVSPDLAEESAKAGDSLQETADKVILPRLREQGLAFTVKTGEPPLHEDGRVRLALSFSAGDRCYEPFYIEAEEGAMTAEQLHTAVTLYPFLLYDDSPYDESLPLGLSKDKTKLFFFIPEEQAGYADIEEEAFVAEDEGKTSDEDSPSAFQTWANAVLKDGHALEEKNVKAVELHRPEEDMYWLPACSAEEKEKVEQASEEYNEAVRQMAEQNGFVSDDVSYVYIDVKNDEATAARRRREDIYAPIVESIEKRDEDVKNVAELFPEDDFLSLCIDSAYISRELNFSVYYPYETYQFVKGEDFQNQVKRILSAREETEKYAETFVKEMYFFTEGQPQATVVLQDSQLDDDDLMEKLRESGLSPSLEYGDAGSELVFNIAVETASPSGRTDDSLERLQTMLEKHAENILRIKKGKNVSTDDDKWRRLVTKSSESKGLSDNQGRA
jgi:HrpA-like RNA helicase